MDNCQRDHDEVSINPMGSLEEIYEMAKAFKELEMSFSTETSQVDMETSTVDNQQSPVQRSCAVELTEGEDIGEEEWNALMSVECQDGSNGTADTCYCLLRDMEEALWTSILEQEESLVQCAKEGNMYPGKAVKDGETSEAGGEEDSVWEIEGFVCEEQWAVLLEVENQAFGDSPPMVVEEDEEEAEEKELFDSQIKDKHVAELESKGDQVDSDLDGSVDDDDEEEDEEVDESVDDNEDEEADQVDDEVEKDDEEMHKMSAEVGELAGDIVGNEVGEIAGELAGDIVGSDVDELTAGSEYDSENESQTGSYYESLGELDYNTQSESVEDFEGDHSLDYCEDDGGIIDEEYWSSALYRECSMDQHIDKLFDKLECFLASICPENGQEMPGLEDKVKLSVQETILNLTSIITGVVQYDTNDKYRNQCSERILSIHSLAKPFM